MKLSNQYLSIPFADGYGVSEEGRIINFTTGNITNGYPSKGYLQFAFQRDGTRVTFKVHKAVGLLYVPNPNNYTEINHIDGNKANNHFTNLEWCSRSHNVKHAFDTGLRKGSMANRFGKDNIRSKPILQYSLNGELLKEWDSATQIEKELGFDDGSIGQCCKGIYKQSKGFIWKYKQ